MSNLAPTQNAALVAPDDLVTEWLLFERQRGLTLGTVKTYERGLTTYLDWVTLTLDGNPTPRDLLTYKGFLANRYRPATVNTKLSAVRSFYRWLVVTGSLEANPASEIRGARRPDNHIHKRDALTSIEAMAIVSQCDTTPTGKRDRAFLTLMLYCALRTIEVVRANIENLKTQSDRLVLEVWGKGRLEPDEIVVIPRAQESVIRDWVKERLRSKPEDGDPLFVSLSRQTRNKRLSTRGVRYIVKRAYAQAGVIGARKTTHSLRHTAITRAIEMGGDPLQVQRMARHHSFDTTQRYYHEVGRVINPAEDLIEYE